MKAVAGMGSVPGVVATWVTGELPSCLPIKEAGDWSAGFDCLQPKRQEEALIPKSAGRPNIAGETQGGSEHVPWTGTRSS